MLFHFQRFANVFYPIHSPITHQYYVIVKTARTACMLGSVYFGRTHDAVRPHVTQSSQVRRRGEKYRREVGERDEHGKGLARNQRRVAGYELRS